MPGLGAPELLLIAGVVVLLFGAKKLPEFARSLGKAKSEFKRGIDEGDSDNQKADTDKPESPSQAGTDKG